MSNNQGDLLRKYLRENGINQAVFAEEAGISRNTLLNYFKYSELPKDFSDFLKKKEINLENVEKGKGNVITTDELIKSKNEVIAMQQEQIELLKELVQVYKDKTKK